MPTYEYVCTECGEPLEAVQSIHDAALTECPDCHGRLRKVFGNVGVVFKGSGFYRTDSRSKSSAAAPPAKKAESSGDSAGSSTAGTSRSDSKPASAPSAPASPAPSATPAPAAS